MKSTLLEDKAILMSSNIFWALIKIPTYGTSPPYNSFPTDIAYPADVSSSSAVFQTAAPSIKLKVSRPISPPGSWHDPKSPKSSMVAPKGGDLKFLFQTICKWYAPSFEFVFSKKHGTIHTNLNGICNAGFWSSSSFPNFLLFRKTSLIIHFQGSDTYVASQSAPWIVSHCL